MKTACFIPIKSNSERVKGKNFRLIGGKALYRIIIEKALQANCFDDIYVDTNSDEIKSFALSAGAQVIDRDPQLALNSANGNDLLIHHMNLKPEYDFFFQLFATAPLISIETLQLCVSKLTLTAEHDSVFTAIPHHGFFWWSGQPINYQPVVLPRSQDLTPVYEETTAIYGITKRALSKYHSRIGAKPIVIEVSKSESIDLNTEEDFHYANWLIENNIVSV